MIVMINYSQKEKKKILNEFLKAFKNNTDLNLRVDEEYISYIGGILTKLDCDGLFVAVDGKWVSV